MAKKRKTFREICQRDDMYKSTLDKLLYRHSLLNPVKRRKFEQYARCVSRGCIDNIFGWKPFSSKSFASYTGDNYYLSFYGLISAYMDLNSRQQAKLFSEVQKYIDIKEKRGKVELTVADVKKRRNDYVVLRISDNREGAYLHFLPTKADLPRSWGIYKHPKKDKSKKMEKRVISRFRHFERLAFWYEPECYLMKDHAQLHIAGLTQADPEIIRLRKYLKNCVEVYRGPIGATIMSMFDEAEKNRKANPLDKKSLAEWKEQQRIKELKAKRF
jgi:hypothetical protein